MVQIQRDITQQELNFVKGLLSLAAVTIQYTIPQTVLNLNDGGMGSIQFIENSLNNYYKDLITVEYIDTDGIPVSITLTITVDNLLYDLDFFKADFNKLCHYPTIDKVIIVKR